MIWRLWLLFISSLWSTTMILYVFPCLCLEQQNYYVTNQISMSSRCGATGISAMPGCRFWPWSGTVGERIQCCCSCGINRKKKKKKKKERERENQNKQNKNKSGVPAVAQQKQTWLVSMRVWPSKQIQIKSLRTSLSENYFYKGFCQTQASG